MRRCVAAAYILFRSFDSEVRVERETACTIVFATDVLQNICIAKRVHIPEEHLGPVEGTSCRRGRPSSTHQKQYIFDC